MARRRFRKAGFNQKLIMDVGLAGLLVRVVPIVLQKFVPLDPTIYTVAGAGSGYLVGSLLKKPDTANAAIALGLVEFVAPMVENLIGGIGGTPLITATRQQTGRPINRTVEPVPIGLSDYLRLNDYITDPSVRQDFAAYKDSY